MGTKGFTFTAVFEDVEDGWVQARVRELPGVITVGPSRGAAEDLLVDALHEYLLALGEMEGTSENRGQPTGAQSVELRVAVGF